MKKKTRIFYREDAKMLRKMKDEDVKRLVLAYLDYEVGEPIENYFQDGDNLQFVFMKMAECIDANETKYNETVQKRREAGKKGGEAKAAKMRSIIDTSTGEVYNPTDEPMTSDLTIDPILEEDFSKNEPQKPSETLTEFLDGHTEGIMRNQDWNHFAFEYPDAEKIRELTGLGVVTCMTLYKDRRNNLLKN